jgi:hypothetical protein
LTARPGAVALSLVLAAGAAAPAQDKPKPGRHHIGPLYVTPRLLLKDAGVDTNVFQTLNDPVKDAVMVLSPRLDGALSAGRLSLTGFGFLDVNYFRIEDEERSTDFYGEGRAEVDLGSLLLFGGGGGGQFNQRFSIDVDDRLQRQEKRANAGATFRFGRRLSLTVQGASEVFTFAPGELRQGGDIKEAMDRNTLTVTGQARYALTSKTTVLLSADALEDRFFSEPANLPRERRSYRYLGGVELGTRALFSGRFLGGLRVFPGTLAEGSPPYQGPVLSADLTIPVARVARLHLVGERDVLYASSLVDVGSVAYRNAFVLERYLADVAFGLPAGLTALVMAGFEESTYLLPYPYPDERSFGSRVDHRYTANVGINRRFGDQIRVGAYFGFARRVSSLPLFSYEGLRYGLNAEILP